MKPRQLSLFRNPRKDHGGDNAKGRRKGARPIATHRPMHITMRSSRAKGTWNLLAHRQKIEAHFYTTANRFGIKTYRFANVGNHLHLLIQAKRRRDFQNFLRVFSQGVCFLVTNAKKGNPVGKFWDALAHSVVVEWGRQYKALLVYFNKNLWEAEGIPRDRVDGWFVWKKELFKNENWVQVG